MLSEVCREVSARPLLPLCCFGSERIPMQFVDKALARRFESCEEMPQVMYARMFQQTRPGIGAAEEEICGGHMIFAGLGSPIGRATGVGLDREFTAADLDRVEEFYRAHKAPSQVDLCPMHEPAVFELFKERGYAIAELNNVLFRKLDAQETFPPPPARCEIRPSRLEEADTAGAIVESAFFPDGAPDAFRGLVAPFYQMERALAFVASVEGRLVACGTGLIIPEHRVFACAVRVHSRNFADAVCRRPCCALAWPPPLRQDANLPLWSRKAAQSRSATQS